MVLIPGVALFMLLCRMAIFVGLNFCVGRVMVPNNAYLHGHNPGIFKQLLTEASYMHKIDQ